MNPSLRTQTSSKVVSLDGHRGPARRLHALLGEHPLLTLSPAAVSADDAGPCVCVRALATEDGTYVALVGETALLTDRFRLGDDARFVVHVDGETPTMCGTAAVTVVGRVAADGAVRAELSAALAVIVRALVADAPFVPRDCAIVLLAPQDVQIDDGESPTHGAVPRT